MPITATVSPGLATYSSAINVPFVAGRFYGPSMTTQGGAASLGSANRLYALPFFVPSTSTLKSLSFNITTGIAGAWNARVGVYTSGSNGLPDALVANSDTLIAVAAGPTTGVQTGMVNGATGVSLSGSSWYWLAFVADTAGQALTSTTGVGMAPTTQGILGGATAAQVIGGSGTGGVYVAHVFAALPSTFGSATYNSNAAAPYVIAGF